MNANTSLHIYASIDALCDGQWLQQRIAAICAQRNLNLHIDRAENAIPRAADPSGQSIHLFVLGAQLSPTDEITWKLRLQQIAATPLDQPVFLLRRHYTEKPPLSAQLDQFCLRHFFHPHETLTTQLHTFCNDDDLNAIAIKLTTNWIKKFAVAPHLHQLTPQNQQSPTYGKHRRLALAIGCFIIAFAGFLIGKTAIGRTTTASAAPATQHKVPFKEKADVTTHPMQERDNIIEANALLAELDELSCQAQATRSTIPADFQCVISMKNAPNSRRYCYLLPKDPALFSACLVTLDRDEQRVEFAKTWGVSANIQRILISKQENRALLVLSTPTGIRLELRELPSWNTIDSYDNVTNPWGMVTFSPDGLIFAHSIKVKGIPQLQVSDATTGENLLRLSLRAGQSAVACHLNAERLRVLFSDATLRDFPLASNRSQQESYLPLFNDIHTASFDPQGNQLFFAQQAWQLTDSLVDLPFLRDQQHQSPSFFLRDTKLAVTASTPSHHFTAIKSIAPWRRDEISALSQTISEVKQSLRDKQIKPTISDEIFQVLEKKIDINTLTNLRSIRQPSQNTTDWRQLWLDFTTHPLNSNEQLQLLQRTRQSGATWNMGWLIQQAIAHAKDGHSDAHQQFLSALGYESSHLAAMTTRDDKQKSRQYLNRLAELRLGTSWMALEARCWLNENQQAEAIAVQLVKKKPLSPPLLYLILKHPFLLQRESIAIPLEESLIAINQSQLWEAWLTQQITHADPSTFSQSVALFLKYQPKFSPFIGRLMASAWSQANLTILQLLIEKTHQLPTLISQTALTRLNWPEHSADCFNLWHDKKPNETDWIKLKYQHSDADPLIEQSQELHRALLRELDKIAVTATDTPEIIDQKIARMRADDSIDRYGTLELRHQCLRAIKASAAINHAPNDSAQLLKKAMQLGADPLACQRAQCQLDSSRHEYQLAYQRWIELINQHQPSQLIADDYLEAANAAIQSGKWPDAIELIQSGYRQYPKNSAFMGDAAWLLINLQQSELALAYLQQARQLGFDPDRAPQHLLMLALAYDQHDDTGLALECYHEALSESTQNKIDIDALIWPEEFKEQLRHIAKLAKVNH